MGVNQVPARQRFAELRAQAADVNVDRAIVVARLAAPDLGVELLAGEDALWVRGQRGQKLQLTHGQAQRPTVDERRVLLWPDLQHRQRAWLAMHGDRLRGRKAPVNYL